MTHDANLWRPPAAAAPVRATGRGAAAQVTKAPEGNGTAGSDFAPQYRRARNGLPMHRDPGRPWWRRVLTNPYVWATLLLTGGYAYLLIRTYNVIVGSLIEEIHDATEELYGQPTILTNAQMAEAWWQVTARAAPTLLVYVAIFILIDRFRPTTWAMKWLALGWGATAAVYISLEVNTWAGELMQTVGPVDPSTGARSAIFAAPFVEEAAKATVLFLLAILLRRRMVGVHQVVVLAGLSAVGFAFTENIVYYLRTFMWSTTIYQTDAAAELDQIVALRGFLLSFGHPLFTSLTALGMVVAIVNRSKLVRVLAPVAGYLAAAFGHMLFNGLASVSDSTVVLMVGGWVAVVALLVLLGFRYVTQIRNIRARLAEMVQLGWLVETDPQVFSSGLTRFRMLLAAALRGPRVFINTLRLQRALTELAYLRDAELRGTVDAMAIERERELVLAAGHARVWGLDHVQGVPFIPPEWGERWRAWRQRRRDLRAAKRAEKRPPTQPWASPTGAPTPVGAATWPPPRH